MHIDIWRKSINSFYLLNILIMIFPRAPPGHKKYRRHYAYGKINISIYIYIHQNLHASYQEIPSIALSPDPYNNTPFSYTSFSTEGITFLSSNRLFVPTIISTGRFFT